MKRTAVLTTTFAIYLMGMFALACIPDAVYLPREDLASIAADGY